MKKEKSCGAIVYKVEEGGILFLVERMTLGHTSLPKGHVEGEETEEETALREIREETSLEVTIDPSFRKVITYSPYPGILKDVVFFLARCDEDKPPIDRHDEEVKESLWLPYRQAVDALTYQDDKDLLEEANRYLKATSRI